VKDKQSGFVTVVLLAMMPLLLAGLALFFSSYLLMGHQGKVLHTCRVQLLDSQEKVRKSLQALLDLNPAAEELRAERDAAEAAADTNPYVGIPWLASVQARQAVLAAQQKALIVEGTLESVRGPARARSAMNDDILAGQKLHEPGTITRSSPRTSTRMGAFSVEANPQESITPDYQPSRDFSDRQTMQVESTVPLEALVPSWLKPWVQFKGLDIKSTCSATLEKGKNSWEAKLKADRS
jgi:hypothetical protein